MSWGQLLVPSTPLWARLCNKTVRHRISPARVPYCSLSAVTRNCRRFMIHVGPAANTPCLAGRSSIALPAFVCIILHLSCMQLLTPLLPGDLQSSFPPCMFCCSARLRELGRDLLRPEKAQTEGQKHHWYNARGSRSRASCHTFALISLEVASLRLCGLGSSSPWHGGFWQFLTSAPNPRNMLGDNIDCSR